MAGSVEWGTTTSRQASAAFASEGELATIPDAMIELRVTRNGVAERWQLVRRRILFGRSVDAEVPVRTGTVARHHARLAERDGRLWLEDLRSTNGTRLEGVSVEGEVPIEVGQSFTLANEAEVKVVAHRPVIGRDFESREASFLQAVARDPHDEAVREVYGDHLEERGEVLRAEWLRAELALRRSLALTPAPSAPIDPRRLRLLELRNVTQRLQAAPRWRMLVSRPSIEGCARLECTSRWNELEALPNEAAMRDPFRRCGRCGEAVAYRDDTLPHVAAGSEGRVIAVDRVTGRGGGDDR